MPPQPVDLQQLEISESNFEDADLDLTVIEACNDQKECLENPTIQEKVPIIEDKQLVNDEIMPIKENENILLKKIESEELKINELETKKIEIEKQGIKYYINCIFFYK